ncbi:uncharacterized protein LOC134470182 [Engraulis encrasicolus]|uniref:uncharacterized protein LOC134470182 n=1 Tax=Engraulis encrasicolus TaxID=184585 RepID=UPI002FD5BBBA
MASAGHQVWVGFIDGLPVVGSVKEAVEWVLAVAADDSLKAKLKLDAINGRLPQKSRYDKYSRSSSGYASDSTWAGYSSDSSTSSGFSSGKPARHDTKYELKCVPDVNLKAYITEVAKGTKSQQTGKPPVKSKTDQKKLQEIRDMTLRKIQRINQNFEFNNPLVDDGKRARRGEHVINNDVISFYYKTVDDFMKETFYMPNTLGIESPLDNNTSEAIQTELVVHFDEDELYINANALIYGEYSRVLKQALKSWLLAPSQELVGPVNRIVQIMNEEEAYVDPLARDKYIRNQNARRVRVETIRGRVVDMLTNWLQYFQAAKTGIDAIHARR